MKTQVIEQITIAQAHDTIVQAAKIYFSRDQRGHYRVERRRARPICLIGPAGIGKTEIVRQAAYELGIAFLSYSVTHHTRQSAIGLPRLVEGVAGGRVVSMTEYTMSEIIAQVYRTMEETGKQEGILFLDEFNCASESLRPIMLQLLQDKSFGPHKIPDGWMLVLAGNPSEYNRAAGDLDAVTADRMRMMYVQPDYNAWRAYVRKRKIHPVVLSYLDNHKDSFYVYRRDEGGTALVTARGWEDLSTMLLYLEDAGEKPDLPLVAQYIQTGNVARSFFSYWQQYGTIVASGVMEQILQRSPKAAMDLREMSFDRAWSLVSALLQRLRTMAAAAVSLDDTAAAAHKALKDIKAGLEKGKTPELDTALLEHTKTVEDRPAREFLERCAMLAAGEGGWPAIKGAFQKEIRQPRMDAYQNTGEAIANAIAVCRRGLEGKPHLEFLFNGLCDSREVVQVIAGSDSEEFRQLFEDTSFDLDAATRELEEQLNTASGL